LIPGTATYSANPPSRSLPRYSSSWARSGNWESRTEGSMMTRSPTRAG
jgi:hypothetical protein